eukprot:m.33874 g.33874  ORF g.33874 m.33874 type:complete len:292 (+) comp9688_c0_seq1:172-1047(+)
MRVLKPTAATSADGTLPLFDASEFRPETKAVEEFRDFTEASDRFDLVRKTYHEMHTKQTVAYVEEQQKLWCKFDHAEMTMMEALEELNKLVDDSDPDVDIPNIVHAFQTAERIREKHPDNEWFQFVGLIHDAGKVMAIWGQPQWSTVGDTFVVGCKPESSIVFHEQFAENPDNDHVVYSTKHGMYTPNCGLSNVTMSWGHDEYLYKVLLHNKASIPEEGLYMIRYHSFYPWHTGGSYQHLLDDTDKEMLKWIKEFNQFDLYSKSDKLPNVEELKPYYQRLCDKFCPGVLKW